MLMSAFPPSEDLQVVLVPDDLQVVLVPDGSLVSFKDMFKCAVSRGLPCLPAPVLLSPRHLLLVSYPTPRCRWLPPHTEHASAATPVPAQLSKLGPCRLLQPMQEASAHPTSPTWRLRLRAARCLPGSH